ncbi:MAG: fumarylacetoacetate hydrolase family protein [Gammaproteobacteria bacterium]|nr:fumarylacetoacetate hydrolase family protein [Gammaproteobacteria bacterium]
MKLATYSNGKRDGELMVVSSDQEHVISASPICPTLISAMEDWLQIGPRLEELSHQLNSGVVTGQMFDPHRCMAPLPRAPQWLDGSAFLNHGRLVSKAFKIPADESMTSHPLVYQGASDDFRGPYEPIEFPDESLQIDMEGEFGVIVDEIAMGTSALDAQNAIRLLLLINDWSLRADGPREMKRGFGFLQAKPSSSFAPLAITPDELGDNWNNGRVHLPLHIEVNGQEVGRANGAEMDFSFGEIIAYAAKTRRLSAGTVIGSGTVSNADRTAGSSCISEIQVIELLDKGEIHTPFLSFNDRVRMQAKDDAGTLPFGELDQIVVQAHI